MSKEEKIQALPFESLSQQLSDAEAAVQKFVADGGEEPADKWQRALYDEAQNRRAKLNEDMVWVLKDPRGRRTIYRLLALAQPYKGSFVPEKPFQTAFNEGRRDVGLALMEMVNAANADAYPQMLREHASDRKSDAARLKKLKEEAGA